jgi:hypothetical protein
MKVTAEMSATGMNVDSTDPLVARAIARSAEFPLISIQGIPKRYDVSLRTLRRWHAAGLMPPRTKHGKWLKYDKSDISALMAARNIKPR